jgi:adenylyl-sulfate kinase
MNRATVWLTGRPASGKTTLAAALEGLLVAAGYGVQRIDGDELRRTVCRELGFSREDRAENVRRAGECALAAVRAGKVAVVSLISPYATDRERVRTAHRQADILFIEVHVDCPLDVAEARDPKGLYRRVRAGELRGFTGIDDPYEAPSAAEVVLDTSQSTVQEATQCLLECLQVCFAAATGPRPIP